MDLHPKLDLLYLVANGDGLIEVNTKTLKHKQLLRGIFTLMKLDSTTKLLSNLKMLFLLNEFLILG